MRVVIFCHSLRSDWNHGNAHFLRGVVSEMLARGMDVRVYEPRDAWSAENLVKDHGVKALAGYRDAYPQLGSLPYTLGELDLDVALAGADLVLVHEWNDHELVGRIGWHRHTKGDYVLLFHDTHHRSATEPKAMAAYDLRGYDGVLAFGEVIQKLYLKKRWAKRAWVWHEAADPRVFKPIEDTKKEGDLVWIGNWGDEERTEELHEFLLRPVSELGLKAKVYGVRYPDHAKKALKAAGIEYDGWLPNYKAPEVFAKYRLTVHVPRRPYVRALPGIPTIRVFEALSCGIPLISAPWHDSERLFKPGVDFLVARNGREMMRQMNYLLSHPEDAERIAERGKNTVLSRHTCSHRVDELLGIVRQVQAQRERTHAA